MTFFPCRMDTTATGDKIIIRNDLRPYKTALDVRMDPACGLLRVHASFNGPGPHLVLAVGQKRDQAEQAIGNADKLVQRRFLNAEVVEKSLCVSGRKLGYLHLDLPAHAEHLHLPAFEERLKIGDRLLRRF